MRLLSFNFCYDNLKNLTMLWFLRVNIPKILNNINFFDLNPFNLLSFYFWMFRYVMIIRRPRTTNAVWSNFVMQITPLAWFVYGLILILFIILFRVLGKFSRRENIPLKFSDTFMIVVASVTGKG